MPKNKNKTTAKKKNINKKAHHLDKYPEDNTIPLEKQAQEESVFRCSVISDLLLGYN